jgi:hypothetical protein
MNNTIKKLLKSDHLSLSDLDLILESINKFPSNKVIDFYISCVLEDVKHLAVFSKIKESDFLILKQDHQDYIVNHIAYLIKSHGGDFSLVPTFMANKRNILLSFVCVYFDASEKEIEIFKSVIIEAGLHKDFDFICETFKYDDGSISYQIADKSIMELPEYWIKVAEAYYHSPKEYILYDQMTCGIPDKFMNNISFIKKLIAISPNIILTLNDNWKEHNELCEIVLTKNGMLLEFLPESVKNSPHLAFIALKQNPEATQFISDELTYNVNFIKKVVNENPKVLEYSIPRMKYLYNNG